MSYRKYFLFVTKLAVIIAVPLFLFSLLVFKRGDTEFFEFLATDVTPFIAWPIRFVTNLLPFSLTELLAWLLPLFLAYKLIYWLIYTIIRFAASWLALFHLFNRSYIRKWQEHNLNYCRYTGRLLLVILFLFSYAFSSYLLFHGYNFERKTLADKLHYDTQHWQKKDLKQASEIVVKKLNTLCHLESAADAAKTSLEQSGSRKIIMEDKKIIFPDSDEKLFNLAVNAYRLAARKYEFLAGQTLKVKAVSMSHYWSYTLTNGMYMPLLLEANVNVTQAAPFTLFSAAHELAHQRFFAHEDEANFLAFLTLSSSDDERAVYAAYLNAWIYLANDLYNADKTVFLQLYRQLPPQAKKDVKAANDYYQRYSRRPISQKSQNLNDTFIRANGDARGIVSYDEVSKLLIAYFNEQLKERK